MAEQTAQKVPEDGQTGLHFSLILMAVSMPLLFFNPRSFEAPRSLLQSPQGPKRPPSLTGDLCTWLSISSSPTLLLFWPSAALTCQFRNSSMMVTLQSYSQNDFFSQDSLPSLLKATPSIEVLGTGVRRRAASW